MQIPSLSAELIARRWTPCHPTAASAQPLSGPPCCRGEEYERKTDGLGRSGRTRQARCHDKRSLECCFSFPRNRSSLSTLPTGTKACGQTRAYCAADTGLKQ